ncbi:hypothetical protein SAVIM40S_07639 [Streptomyces avidinii]
MARSSFSADRLASRTCASASFAWSGHLPISVRGHSRLHVDQGDVMGHHVVQVPGDPQPLLGDPPPGLLVPGPLGALGPFRIAPTKARRLRTASPAAAAMPVQAKIPMFSCAYQGSGPASMPTPVSPAIVSSPIRQVVGRSVRAATVYRAITVHMATGARGSPVVSSSRDNPQVTASTTRG